MKKILIALTIVISFLGINKVSAETLFLTDTTEDNFIQYKEMLGTDNFNAILEDMLYEYKNNYMSSYPYFVISIENISYYISNEELVTGLKFILSYYSSKPTLPWTYSISGSVGVYSFHTFLRYDNNQIGRFYSLDSSDISDFNLNNYTNHNDDVDHYLLNLSIGFDGDEPSYTYNPYLYYMSNFDLYLESLNNIKDNTSSAFIWDYDSLGIPKLGEESLNTIVSFDREDYLIEPYSLYDTDVDVEIPNIEEINLNDYAYVALALKDYSKYNYSTTIEVKGQYCPTPVYGMGLETSEDIWNTQVTDVCTLYYDEYTPYRINFYESIVKSFPVYYVKAYDTTRDNYIKVDTNVFDITYITEEEKDNPYVLVQGKYYPTIPFDKLPSNSLQNTQNGYIPGDSINSFSFEDIFTSPLDFLNEIWSSIVIFFKLITSFILLLPAPMQGFLYASFSLAIVLGLIKIIIG